MLKAFKWVSTLNMRNFYHNICKKKVFHLYDFFSRIFKGLDKILFFFNSRSRVGKIEILDQGLSRFNLDKPWSSRQVRGQLFQGQGLSFKGEYSIFIQGFFKGNPWNSSKFKATSRFKGDIFKNFALTTTDGEIP